MAPCHHSERLTFPKLLRLCAARLELIPPSVRETTAATPVSPMMGITMPPMPPMPPMSTGGMPGMSPMMTMMMPPAPGNVYSSPMMQSNQMNQMVLQPGHVPRPMMTTAIPSYLPPSMQNTDYANQPSAPPMWSTTNTTAAPPRQSLPVSSKASSARVIDHDTNKTSSAIRSSQEELRKSWKNLEEQQKRVQEQQWMVDQQQQQMQRQSWEMPTRDPLQSRRRRNREQKREDYGFKTKPVVTRNSSPEAIMVEAEVVPNKLDNANEELLRFSRMRQEFMEN